MKPSDRVLIVAQVRGRSRLGPFQSAAQKHSCEWLPVHALLLCSATVFSFGMCTAANEVSTTLHPENMLLNAVLSEVLNQNRERPNLRRDNRTAHESPAGLTIGPWVTYSGPWVAHG